MFAPIWVFFAVHLWGILGSLGAIGLVLLVIGMSMLGWQLGAIVTAALNLLRTAIGFFETPFGEVIGIILLLIAVAVAVDVHQIRVDNAAVQGKINAALTAAAKKADEDRKARDDYVAQKVSADADQHIKEIEAEKADLEKKANDYETALKNAHAGDPAAAVCAVAPGDVPVRVPNDGRRH